MNSETLAEINKYIHIGCGAITLGLGLIQIAMPRKGSLHRMLGKIYFYLMLVICITALPPAFYHGNWFLVSVSFFSFYMVWAGQRYGHHKGQARSFTIEKLVTIYGLLTTIGLFAVTFLLLMKGAGGISFVPAAFGLLLFLNCLQDFKYYFLKYRNPNFRGMDWYFLHIGRMIGSYIASVTAFLVNVQPFGSHWINWLLPGVIGGFFIAAISKRAKKKFGMV